MNFISKNTIKIYVLLCAIVVQFTVSCKRDLEDNFLNPDGYTAATIEGFYVNALQRLGTFRYDYGEFWQGMSVFPRMLGTAGFVNNGLQNTYGWGHDFYSGSFSRMRSIAELERIYDRLSENEKQDYKSYYLTSKITQCYIYYQLVDIYNKVPYFDALKGKDNIFAPKFDEPQAVYMAILTELENAAVELGQLELGSSLVEQQFATNDILLNGDLNLWRVFANSLSLRLALRMINIDPETAMNTVQRVYQSGMYARDRASSILMTERREDLALELLLPRALIERRGSLWLSQDMLSLLRQSNTPDDPRLKVLFQPDRDGKYSAIQKEGPYAQEYALEITQNNLSQTYPSIYNRTTFEQNFAMPAPVITSTEVHLILAESAVRWPSIGINAQEEYELAIRQSIDMYYELNRNNTRMYLDKIAGSQPSAPDASITQAFLMAKKTVFAQADNLEKIGLIYDQKFVDMNILKPYELWSETRRLYLDLGSRIIKKPTNIRFMERTIYPTSESVNNQANFREVFDQNNFTTPVWFTGRTNRIMDGEN